MNERQPRKTKSLGRRAPIIFGAGGLAVIGIVVAVLLWVFKSPSVPLPGEAVEPASTSTSAPGGASTDQDVLGVATSWPRFRGCDFATQLAVPSAVAANYKDQKGDEDSLIAAGAGAWYQGHLYLFFTAKGDEQFSIINIKPHIQAEKDSIAWILAPDGGCGAGNPERVFALDLDAATLKSVGIDTEDSNDSPPPDDARTEPLGPTFNVSKGHPATVRIDSTACKANYSWTVTVQYQVAGSSTLLSIDEGPFFTFGNSNSTPVLTPTDDADATNFPTQQEDTVSGAPARC